MREQYILVYLFYAPLSAHCWMAVKNLPNIKPQGSLWVDCALWGAYKIRRWRWRSTHWVGITLFSHTSGAIHIFCQPQNGPVHNNGGVKNYFTFIGHRTFHITADTNAAIFRYVCNRAFWPCVSWGFQLVCRSSCTVCNWKAFLLNELACVPWGDLLLCRSNYIVCNWKALLLNGLTCVSWDDLLLCRSNCTVCSWKAFHLNGLACASWG